MIHLYVSLSQQKLFLFEEGRCIRNYPVSTAKQGAGEEEGSYCTPRGWHKVVEVIGQDQPIYTIFRARKATNELYIPALRQATISSDLILSRIIRLQGSERGFNLGGRVDTYARFIYIHGCAEEDLLGEPASHGCIRMSNLDVVELANIVHIEHSVFIG